MKARIVREGEIVSVGVPLVPTSDRPSGALVVVENDQGAAIACVTVLSITHFEGLWVDPAYRRHPGVMRALMRQAVAIPSVRGEQWVLGAAASDDTIMLKLLDGLGGAPLRATFTVLPIGEGSCLMRF